MFGHHGGNQTPNIASTNQQNRVTLFYTLLIFQTKKSDSLGDLTQSHSAARLSSNPFRIRDFPPLSYERFSFKLGVTTQGIPLFVL